jgi:nucleoside-diphosphate-sugar epimerase
MAKSKKSNKPTALILHGANFLGKKLADLLTTQDTNIIAVDEFTKRNKKYLKDFKSEFDAQTYDLSAIPSLHKDLKRVDYVFILLDQFMLSHRDISSKYFISETNILDTVFKLAIEHSAKVTLASSISIHRKLANTEQKDVDNLSEATNENPYTTAELQRYSENLAAEYHDKAGLDVRICRLGEVIGKGMPLDSNTTFVDMIKESITKPRITIPGEGLDYAYYVHNLDAVYGLIKASFSGKTRGAIFTLALPDEISTLNLAYRILELNPKANEIEFAKAEKETGPQKVYVPAKNLKKIGWKPKVGFEKALIETIEYFYDEYNLNWKDKPQAVSDKKIDENKVKKVVPRSEKITPFGKFLFSVTKPIKKSFKTLGEFITSINPLQLKPKIIFKKLLIGVAAILIYFVLAAPILQVLIGGSLTYYYGQKGYREAYNLETDKAEASLNRAAYFSSLMNSGWYGLRWIKIIPGLSEFYTETTQLTDGVEHLTKAGQKLTVGVKPYAEYFKQLEPTTSFNETTGGSSRTYQNELEDMEEGVTHIDEASIEISLARESLGAIDPSAYPGFVRDYLRELQNRTDKLEDSVNQANEFAYFLPEILGKEGRQTYVILFQNPMEIRSTGGWLTSYAIVGIEHGQIRNLKVEDVYTVDGQIDKQIDPPESMQAALDVNQWNLSLSNWSPDFPESAEAAEYFLQLQDRIVTADGVIAIDLEYVRELIDIWGEIGVPGETDPVTKENIYDKVVEIHREFTPGSTNKPVFLSNLANELLKKLVEDGKDEWSQVADKTVTALDEKHVLIYMHNNEVSQILDDMDWDGRLQPTSNIIYPVEWNWGGNKANYFINRSLYFNSNILDENTLQQKLVITYQNTSEANTYPEGDYENYMRVYIPENAEVVRVEGIENAALNSNISTDMQEISGWVNVPIQTRKTLTITYRLERNKVENFPIEIKPDNIISLQTNIIKQPGFSNDPLTIEINYPQEWEPQEINNVRRELNSLIKRTELDTDKALEFSWKR